jgi:two-component system chemotaxis sensor kinase CheA
MQDQEIIREFLIESNENLAKLDRELVELERRPDDSNLIGSIFRTIHTIKGTSGFFGFSILGSITHIAENILSQIRDRERMLTPELASLILETVDGVKAILASIEATNEEGKDIYEDLRKRLDQADKAVRGPASSAGVGTSPPTPEPASPEQAQAFPPADVIPPGNAVVVPAQTAPTPSQASPAESMPKEQEPGVQKNSALSDSSIRVDVVLLDRLMNLVGELVLARNQILQVTATNTQDSALGATSQRLNLITTELQEGVMKMRMQPIGVVWGKLPRVVRDLAASCGKKIQLEMEGSETELDKTIVEAIKDPLTHIVRNSCDHGIEMPDDRIRAGKNPQGTLFLRAYHEGGHVNIEISDDGGGIDPQRVKNKALQKGLIGPEQAARMSEREVLDLVFMPGFSTAEQVTSISGRGVGMDVVRTNIEKIGGVVDLSSQQGQSTTIRIKIPLTLAIIPGLLVTLQNRKNPSAGEERFVIPQANLVELIRLEREEIPRQIEKIQGTSVYRRRGKLLPLVYLDRILRMAETREESETTNIVVLQAEEQHFGLVVDSISDTQEIVVKPLSKQLKSLNCYAGATIMGDGRVALIIDVVGLAQRGGVIAEVRDRALVEKADAVADTDQEKRRFLLFSGPGESHMAVPLDNLARLEELPASQVEKAGVHWVTQYRGKILPLVHLEFALAERRRHRQQAQSSVSSSGEPLQVLVCNHKGHSVGLVVERILDIVEDAAQAKYPASRAGVLYSTVINGRVTELIDIPAILQQAGLNLDNPKETLLSRAEVAH